MRKEEEITQLKKKPVINLKEFSETRVQQRLTRYSCHTFIKRQRGDRDGGGGSSNSLAI